MTQIALEPSGRMAGGPDVAPPLASAETTTVHFPRPAGLIRHALPHVAEGMLIPAAMFYAGLWLFNVWGGLFLVAGWSYTAVIRKALRRQRIGGLLALTAVTITVRLLMAVLSGSAAGYFLQPLAARIAVAIALVATAAKGRSLLERMAGDLVPMPDCPAAQAPIRRWFGKASLAWAAMLVVHAVVGAWLLFTQPIEVYVVANTTMNAAVKGGGIGGSALWLLSTLRNAGIGVRFG